MQVGNKEIALLQRKVEELCQWNASQLIASLLIVPLLIAPQITLAATIAGATTGQLNVEPTGAAVYNIPITVSPGIAGIEPKLSLIYNSQRGNGLLGVGWSLTGLSAITRCPKTLIEDGVKVGIQYDATDRYCLDGQRLVVSNGGTYGANNTEYRTERDSFSKIVSYGGTAATAGPAYFKVLTKAGQILEFGNTVEATDAQSRTIDSRIEAQGKTAIQVWALNKISDIKSNYLTISYVEDKTNGQYYPDRIDYTGNTTANKATDKSVRFIYDTARTDITPMFEQGSQIKITALLKNIQTYAGSKWIKDYQLVYELSAPTQRSRLKTLTECDGEAPQSCLKPTVLAWQSSDNTFVAAANSNLTNISLKYSNRINQSYSRYIPMDGLCTPSSPSSSYYPYGVPPYYGYLCNPSRSYTITWTQRVWPTDRNTALGDFNGDGKSDLLIYESSSATNGQITSANNKLYFANTDGSFTESTNFTLKNTAIFHSFESSLFYPFFFPGQYPPEWFDERYANSGTEMRTWNYMVSDQSKNFRLGDFNGDGRTDILVTEETNSNHTLWFSNGDGTFSQVPAATFNLTSKTLALSNNSGIQSTNPYAGWAGSVLGDFNGDGKTDILRYTERYAPQSGFGYANAPTGVSYYWPCTYADIIYNTPNALFLSNGDGSFTEVASTTFNLGLEVLSQSAKAPYNAFTLGDFNGDGKTDVLIRADDAQNKLYLSNGDGSFTLSANFNLNGTVLGIQGGTQGMSVADFNGDGKTDILKYADSAQNKLYLSKGDGSFVEATNFTLAQSALSLSTLNDQQRQNFVLADFNGDGKSDILKSGAYNFALNKMYLSNGDGTFHEATTTSQSSDINNAYLQGAPYASYLAGLYSAQSRSFFMGDFNGDGKEDIIRFADQVANPGSNALLWEQGAVANDYLQSITDGLGLISTLTYKPLTDDTVYTKGSGSVYPVMDLQVPMYVVSNASSGNGVGGSNETRYTYASGKSHQRGGGFLGFGQVNATEVQAGILTTSFYGQGSTCSATGQVDTLYPYCLFDRGLHIGVEKHSSASGTPILKKVTNTWSFATNTGWGAQYHVPHLKQSNETNYDLVSNGTAQGPIIAQSTACYIDPITLQPAYDTYGSILYSGVWSANVADCAALPAKTDLFVKETSNTYLNDTTNWFLGRLKRSVVTSTVPTKTTRPYLPPTLTSITPNQGSVGGGTTIALTGTNFTDFATGAQVTIGGKAATGCTVNSLTSMTCTTTADTAGAKDVVVTIMSVSTTLANGFTYMPPTLTAVSPNQGDYAGGTAITLTGSYFANGATVTIGGVATECTFANSTTMNCITPTGMVGAKDIVVNVAGYSATLAGGFTYLFNPVISADTQNYNLRAAAIAAGWDPLTPLNTTVTVNTSIVISSSSTATPAFEISGTYPAGSSIDLVIQSDAYIVGKGGAGGKPGLPGGPALKVASSAATVQISNNGVIGGGGGGGGHADGGGWTGSCDNGSPRGVVAYGGGGAGYGPGPGAVGGLTTGGTGAGAYGVGSGAGGALGAAGGTGIDGDGNCSFSPNWVGGTGGAAVLGEENIIWLVAGTRLGSTNSARVVSLIQPNTGYTWGGETITVSGSGFVSAMTVTIGGVAATGCIVNAARTSITCATPANSAGIKDVVVSSGGVPNTLVGAFTYQSLAVNAIAPSSGYTTGGTAVTLTGSGFAAGANVTIGSVAATGCTVASSTSMTCTTPAGTVGAKDVVVSLAGHSTTLTGGFTYTIAPFNFSSVPTSVQNYNLRAAAIAAGWDQVKPLIASVTINNGVIISSSSTATPAFTTNGAYPSGSSIDLMINSGAYIVGKGGAGGKPGLSGGPAISIAASAATVRITNNGVIGGGGGGGGDSGSGWRFSCDNGTPYGGNASGGGGAGYGTSSGAAGGLTTGGAGATSWGASSGAGGSLGAAGGPGYGYDNNCSYGLAYPGGTGGAATIGAANATWLWTGTRLGAVQ